MWSENLFSLKHLLAIGFVLAALPLFVAVIYSALAMQETAGLSEKAIYQMVEQTKITRSVMQKVGDIERKARLFVVLSDLSLPQPYERESYEAARAQLKEGLGELLKAESDNKLALLINELSEKERLIYEQVIGSEPGAEARLPVDEAFRGLHDAAAALWQEIASQVDRKVEELHEHTKSVQQGLLFKGAALALVSLAFVSGFLTMLTGSIRQMDESIRRLGSGDIVQPIRVTGPKDLRYLGDRLEWLRSRLLALEDSKQQFMRNVSQELQMPLEGVWDNTAALAAEPDLKPEQRDRVARLAGDVEQLRALFEEMLQYNRINENPQETSREAVNMKDLLDSVIEDYHTRLREKSLTLRELAQPVMFFGAPDQLRTIIDNLLSNAVKFSPEGGEIRVILRVSGSTMELEVEDDGPGIDPAEAGRLFEPFFRGKAAESMGSGGSGLGLAIVSECVANHQGRVEIIEPRQDEKGARFRVELPLAEAA